MLETFACDAIIRRALAGGGEFADIYYEAGIATLIAVEDGKVEKVLATTDQGVGIRVISDCRTAYAYTNEISEDSLLALAETVSRAVRGKAFDRPIAVGARQLGASLPIAQHPGSIPLRDKVARVSRAEQAARAYHDQVRQVMTLYRDGVAKVQTVNSLGEFTENERIGTLFV
ncbi:MAG TPA: DNA gyrase modulator, partial [Geobacteraceae bacterium]